MRSAGRFRNSRGHDNARSKLDDATRQRGNAVLARHRAHTARSLIGRSAFAVSLTQRRVKRPRVRGVSENTMASPRGPFERIVSPQRRN